MTSDRSLEDIYTYSSQSRQLIDKNHPHYDEIHRLLTDQIMDDLDDCKHATNRRATQVRKRSN